MTVDSNGIITWLSARPHQCLFYCTERKWRFFCQRSRVLDKDLYTAMSALCKADPMQALVALRPLPAGSRGTQEVLELSWFPELPPNLRMRSPQLILILEDRQNSQVEYILERGFCQSYRDNLASFSHQSFLTKHYGLW